MSHKCHSLLLNRRGIPTAQIASVSHDFEHRQTIPEHSHLEDQLVFASKGVMTVHTRQGIWVVPPMRAVWIPAMTPHSITMSGSVSLRTLYFLPSLMRSRSGKCFVMNVSSLLKELILHACCFSRLSLKVPIQRRIIDIIIDQLQEVHSVPLQLPRPSDSRALRVVQALLDDPGDRRTLQALCKGSGASKRTVERLFKAETKMTFARWRQQMRLLRAMQLLASGEKVTGAALGAGYSSTSAFISMFRKQLGTTPTRYFSTGDRNGA